MAKSHKLLIWLLVIALLLAGFWLIFQRPSLTARDVLRRTERRELRKESAFLEAPYLLRVLRTGQGNVHYHVAVGKTGEELYLAEAVQRGLFWYSEEDLVTVPLSDPVTIDFQPWCAEWEQTAFVYTDLDYDHGVATVRVGQIPFAGQFAPSESGFVVVSFPYLEAESKDDGSLSEQVQLRQYDLRNIGYAGDRKRVDVTLEVVLYDSANIEIARAVKEYPAE